jgi:TolB-like protein
MLPPTAAPSAAPPAVDADSSAWRARIVRRAAAGIGALVLALAMLLVGSYRHRRAEEVRIVVLPFDADSASTAAAATITASVIHRLSVVRGFHVIAPDSVPGATGAYRASRDSAHAIARRLGVRYLLVGRVDRRPTPEAPDRILVGARLIDTEDSPPAIGHLTATDGRTLCPVIATVADDIMGHFARAPRGPLFGPGGSSGCAEPSLFERFDDPGG